jgi:hypothetical protein
VCLVVNLAAVGNPGHIDSLGLIFDNVHYPVIADPDSLLLVAALEFLHPEGRGIVAKRSRRGIMRAMISTGSE